MKEKYYGRACKDSVLQIALKRHIINFLCILLILVNFVSETGLLAIRIV